MKKGMAMLLLVLAVTVISSFTLAGGMDMTKDLDAQYVVGGTWSGEIAPPSRTGRSLEMKFSELQEDGTVKCDRFHLGPLQVQGRGPGPAGEGARDVKVKSAFLSKEDRGICLHVIFVNNKEVKFYLKDKRLVRDSADGLVGTLTKK